MRYGSTKFIIFNKFQLIIKGVLKECVKKYINSISLIIILLFNQ